MKFPNNNYDIIIVHKFKILIFKVNEEDEIMGMLTLQELRRKLVKNGDFLVDICLSSHHESLSYTLVTLKDRKFYYIRLKTDDIVKNLLIQYFYFSNIIHNHRIRLNTKTKFLRLLIISAITTNPTKYQFAYLQNFT